MQVIQYNDQYPNGLTLEIIFRFHGYDWLVTASDKKTYILPHFSNKRAKKFKLIHWCMNRCSIGIWHDRKFITQKELRLKAYKVNEKIIIYERINECPF